MVGEDFAAAVAEGREVAFPGRNIMSDCTVERIDVSDIREGEIGVGKVRAGDDVFIPVLISRSVSVRMYAKGKRACLRSRR